MEASDNIFDPKMLHDVQQLYGVFNVLRLLLIADRQEVAQQLPTLQMFTANTLRMLSTKTKEAVDRQALAAGEKEKQTCKAVEKLFKVCVYVDHFIGHDFSLAYDEAKIEREFEAYFQKEP